MPLNDLRFFQRVTPVRGPCRRSDPHARGAHGTVARDASLKQKTGLTSWADAVAARGP